MLDEHLKNYFSRVSAQGIWEITSFNIFNMFQTKIKIDIVKAAYQFRSMVTYITFKERHILENILGQKTEGVDYRTYFFMDKLILHIRFTKREDFSKVKEQNVDLIINAYSLNLMKNRVMHLIYVFYKYHKLLLELYNKPHIASKDLIQIASFDMFLSRVILHFVDIIMLYVKNIQTINNDTMYEVSQIFCFNWTITQFYNDLIKNKLNHNPIFKLTCLGKFDKPINNRTNIYYDTVYKQWNELGSELPKKISLVTMEHFYHNNRHLGTLLETEDMYAYKMKVCEKFEVLNADGEGPSGSASAVTGLKRQSVIQSVTGVYQAGGSSTTTETPTHSERSTHSKTPTHSETQEEGEPPVKRQAPSYEMVVVDPSENEEEDTDQND